MRLVLWRHGQTTWNVEARFQGHTDIALDETGAAQAERAGRRLAALHPDAIISSDLRRAATTASTLARVTGLPVSFDKDLRERFGGSWEGLTAPVIRERYPAAATTWTPPDGETNLTVAERVAGVLERTADTLPGGSLAVIVSHGVAIRLGMSRLMGLPENLWGVYGPLSNCSWSTLGLRRGRWRLLEHNAGTLPEPAVDDR